jgi:uncharacterized integral membrane protein
MATDKTDKSLPSLFSDLARETVDLVRQEMALARAEISQKITSAERGLVALIVGGVIILAGLMLLLQAVVNALGMALPEETAPWLAPLIVGAVVAVIGYAMLKGGRSRLQPDNLMPNRTVESLRRDAAVAQETVR